MYEGSIHEVHSKFVMVLFQQAFHSNYFGETYDGNVNESGNLIFFE